MVIMTRMIVRSHYRNRHSSLPSFPFPGKYILLTAHTHSPRITLCNSLFGLEVELQARCTTDFLFWNVNVVLNANSKENPQEKKNLTTFSRNSKIKFFHWLYCLVKYTNLINALKDYLLRKTSFHIAQVFIDN